MSIEPVDAEELAASQPLDQTASYLAAIIKRGPAAFVDNAHGRMEALRVDGKPVPLVITDAVAGNSNVCSAYAHYYRYPAHEIRERYGRATAALLSAPMMSYGAMLRACAIDRIVFVNNHLLSTNPRHGLTAAQIAQLTQHLIRRFPDSAIVFRSINLIIDPDGADALRGNGYQLVPSRRVYLLDTASERYLERSNFRVDLAMLKRTPYAILDSASDDLTPHAARFAQLYRGLYLNKHSEINPQFNSDFFAMVLSDRFLCHRAFVREGRVDAFMSCFREGRTMTASLIGYDLDQPRKLALYRIVIALAIEEAAQRGAMLNLSAGSGHFKMLRGAEPIQEYDAVYARHLRSSRRLGWSTLRGVARIGSLVPHPRA